MPIRRFDKSIFVTRPYLPDIEAFKRMCKENCNVFARRYFYPLLTDFVPYRHAQGTCPVPEDAARMLPTYYGLVIEDAVNIAESIREIVE